MNEPPLDKADLEYHARHIKAVMCQVLFWGDTSKIRALMASGSIFWAWALTFFPEILDRHSYELMSTLPIWIWVALFSFHGVGGWWRIIELRERPHWEDAVNMAGIIVWASAAFAQNISVKHIIPATGLELLGCFFLVTTFGSSQQNKTDRLK